MPILTGTATERPLEPLGELGDRAEDDLGHEAGALERLGPELAGADERGPHPERLGAADVGLDVVGHHPRQLGLRAERVERRREVGRARLAEDRRVDARRVLEPRHEGAGVEQRAAARLPPLVLVQAVELGAHLQLGERPAEVHPREHLVRLGRLVAAAEQHRVGVVADELDALEIGHDRAHHEREHALARELAGGGPRRRLELVVVELEPEQPQLLGERRARPGGVVRHEAEGVALPAKPGDGLDGAGDRLAGDMEDAVDIEQDAGHRRHSPRRGRGRGGAAAAGRATVCP